jgi:hypothetical protein
MEQPKILDLYVNDEIILRIYNNPDDITQFEQIHIFVEDHGVSTEKTRLIKRNKVSKRN